MTAVSSIRCPVAVRGGRPVPWCAGDRRSAAPPRRPARRRPAPPLRAPGQASGGEVLLHELVGEEHLATCGVLVEHRQLGAGGQCPLGPVVVEQVDGVVEVDPYLASLAAAVLLHAVGQPLEQGNAAAAVGQGVGVAPLPVHDPPPVPAGDELVVVEHRVVPLELPLERLAHETGEEGGPPFGDVAFDLDLLDEQLQEERRAEQIELRRRMDLGPDLGPVQRRVQLEVVTNLGVRHGSIRTWGTRSVGDDNGAE